MACGSDARTHVGLWLRGTRGSSDRFEIVWCWASMMVAPMVIHKPGTGRVTRLLRSSEARKAGHAGAEMLYMVAGGWCRSLNSGARNGRK